MLIAEEPGRLAYRCQLLINIGLPATRKVTVTLSDGSRQERQLYGELRVQVGDRDDVFSCVAKPEGAPLLLGQIVLEALDLVVDYGIHALGDSQPRRPGWDDAL